MLRAKQLASSMAALAAVGIVAAVVGLSVFSASGQTGDGVESRAVSKQVRPSLKESEKPAPATYVKTYYVGDLLMLGRVNQPATAKGAGDRRWVDMTPLVDLVTSTVAKGTWTIHDGQGKEVTLSGEPVKHEAGAARSETVGAITPFHLSISLIIRHTAEVHDEVADLLRKLRRLVDPPGTIEEEARLDLPKDTKRVPPALPSPPDRNARIRQVRSMGLEPGRTGSSPPDRNTRIRQLLDELRQEVEKLPKESN